LRRSGQNVSNAKKEEKGVIEKAIPRGCQGESSNPHVLGIPTICFQ